jgi:hypothetical protein
MIEQVLVVLLVVAIIMLMWGNESFTACHDCDQSARFPYSDLVVNPFIWPYSGTPCTDDLYREYRTLKAPQEKAPLTHLSTPDHVVLCN